MSKVYDRIDDGLRRWISQQALFFVGTAPVRGEHVNVSPKGPIGSLRVLDDRSLAYLDAVGSGAETIAHVRENGRIVIMLCAFTGKPRIVRFHGRGTVIEPGARFDELLAQHRFEDPAAPAARRAILHVAVTRIADACGYGVPLMDLAGRRNQMELWAERKGEEGIATYKKEKNERSIDGLPALKRP